MRNKSLLLSLLTLLIFNVSFATKVPVNTAKTAGYNYLKQHGTSDLQSESDLSLVYTSGSPVDFYVFSGSHYFVIVTADDAVVPVIGYSKERPFHADHMPYSIGSLFANYNRQIDYVVLRNGAASADIAASWQALKEPNTHNAERTTSVVIVAPLIATTWDQSQYYNTDCPADAGAPFGYGGHVPTGCVATAMSQVMKFWNWPVHGTGSHSYTAGTYGTLSANFGTTTYNWSSMPNSVTSANAAVAMLMSQVGISLEMQYSDTESGSYVIQSTSPITNCAEYALKTYFGYSTTTTHGYPRSSYSDASWISLIEGELDAGRPVLYDGDGTAGGHCWVVDGYDNSDNFHVNWGWSGSGPDGYYYMNSMNPPVLGAGGGAGGFNSNQEAIVGIKPNYTADLEVGSNVNLTQNTIPYGDTFSYSVSVHNFGTTVFNGTLGAAVYNASTNAFVTYLDSVTGVTLAANGVTNISGTALHSMAMIPANYKVVIMYRTNMAGSVWANVQNNSGGLYTNAGPISVYNHNPIELYSAMPISPGPLMQDSINAITLKIFNNGTSTWSDSLKLGLYNMDGTFNTEIQSISGPSLAAAAASGTLTFTTNELGSNAVPGTYLLMLWYKNAGTWNLCGADYDQNPVVINVVAPTGDIYEVNNTDTTAYDLTSTLTWVSDSAHTSTPGATIHIRSDEDYYKVILPTGYNYLLSARVNDIGGTDDGLTYTANVKWSCSVNGGITWSSYFDNTVGGNISIENGDTVLFHVVPAVSGSKGTYLFKIGSLTRSFPAAIEQVDLAGVKVYPNPASDHIVVDLTGTTAQANEITLTDIEGRKVYYGTAYHDQHIDVALNITTGIYFLTVMTNEGVIYRKIQVNK